MDSHWLATNWLEPAIHGLKRGTVKEPIYDAMHQFAIDLFLIYIIVFSYNDSPMEQPPMEQPPMEQPPMEQHWYLRRNRLRQLAAFCQTGTSGSMSEAARQLRLTQPAVSLLIKDLERDLGCPLFTRRGPHLQLRPIGRSLLQWATPLLRQAERLPAELRHWQRKQDSHLSLAINETLLLAWLPRLLRALKQEWSDLLELRVETADRPPLQRILNGDLHLYVGVLAEVPGPLRALPLVPATLRLLVPATHPLAKRTEIAPDELSACNLILPLRSYPPWECLRPVLEENGIQQQGSLYIDGSAALQHFVAEGLGVAVVDDYCLGESAHTAGIPIRPAPECAYAVYLPPPGNDPPGPLVRNFLRLAGVETDTAPASP